MSDKLSSDRNNMKERKIKSLNSIILRSYLFMKVLICDYNYSFVLDRERRKAEKHYPYYGIDVVANEKGEVLFDVDAVNLSSKEKTQYCKQAVIDLMLKELKSKGFYFEERVKRVSTKKYGIYPTITNASITRFRCKREGRIIEFEMKKLEDRMGINCLNEYNKMFKGKLDKIVLCKRGKDVKNLLIRLSKAENNKVMLVEEYWPKSILSYYYDCEIVPLSTTRNSYASKTNQSQ